MALIARRKSSSSEINCSAGILPIHGDRHLNPEQILLENNIRQSYNKDRSEVLNAAWESAFFLSTITEGDRCNE